jgi:small subunit ribosomal protein S6
MLVIRKKRSQLSPKGDQKMSNSYEMMYILRPDLGEEQVQQEVKKYQEFLQNNGVQDVEVQIRGKKRLAYPIKKFIDGIYVLMNYQADGSQIAAIERAMRLSEEVIRYLTIKQKPVKEAKVTETVAAEN